MPDPAALAARLAEIRARHSWHEFRLSPSALSVSEHCEACALLAAYDALAEAVLAFDEASRTALMPRDPYNRMLALARAGLGGKG